MIEAVMVAGEPFEVTFRVLVSGAPDPDFAGFSAKIDLRKNNTNGPLVESWIDGDAEIVRDNVAAALTLKIPASITNAYSFNLGFMDLLMRDAAGGRRSTALQIRLDRGVTR